MEDSAWVCDKQQQAVRGKKVGVRVGRLSQQEACARAALDYQSKNPGKSTGLEADNPVFKAPFQREKNSSIKLEFEKVLLISSSSLSFG